jgi:hypothetical protein
VYRKGVQSYDRLRDGTSIRTGMEASMSTFVTV